MTKLELIAALEATPPEWNNLEVFVYNTYTKYGIEKIKDIDTIEQGILLT